MGFNVILEALAIREGTNTLHRVITSSTSQNVPNMENGIKPHYCLVQATVSDLVAADPPVPGKHWISVALGQSGSGTSSRGIKLVVGNPPIILNVHGSAVFKIGWPSNINGIPTNITFTAIPLES